MGRYGKGAPCASIESRARPPITAGGWIRRHARNGLAAALAAEERGRVCLDGTRYALDHLQTVNPILRPNAMEDPFGGV